MQLPHASFVIVLTITIVLRFLEFLWSVVGLRLIKGIRLVEVGSIQMTH